MLCHIEFDYEQRPRLIVNFRRACYQSLAISPMLLSVLDVIIWRTADLKRHHRVNDLGSWLPKMRSDEWSQSRADCQESPVEHTKA